MNKHLERSTRLLIGVPLVLLVACSEEPETSPTPTSPTPEAETPTATPTMPPDSGVITPTPTPTPVPNPVSSIVVTPGQFQLDLASTVQFRARAFLRSGEETEVTLTWVSSDEGVATLDASGRLTPVSPGVAEITASYDGVSSNAAQVEVLANGKMTITLVDATTRAPLPGAVLYRGLEGTESYTADENGVIVMEGDFSGPQIVTGTLTGYYHSTLYNVVQRTVELPMRAAAEAVQGQFKGDVDFSAMGPLPDNKTIRVGLITRSFVGNPLALDTNTIIGKNRWVDVCGTTTALPSNIVGQTPTYCGQDPELLKYSVPGPTGTFDSYMLSGNLVASDVLTWLTDETIFTNLGKLLITIDNMNTFAYDVATDIEIVAPNTTEGVLQAPDGVTDSPLDIRVPQLPSGIDADYLPVAFALADLGGNNYLPIGVAGARQSSTVSVWHPKEFDSVPVLGLVMAAEAGVGEEGAYVAVKGYPQNGSDLVIPPPFMSLLQVDKLETQYAERKFVQYAVPDTSINRSIFTWKRKVSNKWTDELVWDIWLPAETNAFVVPTLPDSLAFVDLSSDRYVNWESFSYDNQDQSFDVYTSSPDKNISAATLELYRLSRNIIYDITDAQQ